MKQKFSEYSAANLVPGSSPACLKALNSGVDFVFLERGCADDKVRHAKKIIQLNDLDASHGITVSVRINGLDTQYSAMWSSGRASGR